MVVSDVDRLESKLKSQQEEYCTEGSVNDRFILYAIKSVICNCSDFS